MEPKDYMEATSKTAKQFPEPHTMFPHEMDMLHAAMGMSTEANEILDSMKKHIYYGKRVCLTNMKEELGDILWYLFQMMRCIGTDFGEVASMNIKKLAARYPKGYSNESAQIRKLDQEREVLKASQTKAERERIEDTFILPFDEKAEMKKLEPVKQVRGRDIIIQHRKAWLEHPETLSLRTVGKWAEDIGIPKSTFRDRIKRHGNIPEIYWRDMNAPETSVYPREEAALVS